MFTTKAVETTSNAIECCLNNSLSHYVIIVFRNFISLSIMSTRLIVGVEVE